MFTNTLNPILLQLGPFTIRWYGLFLALGVALAILIIVRLFKKQNYPPNLAYDLCTWLIIGGLVGARLGEILFYEPAYYFSHPLEMIMINHGGLSSHGMAVGLIITFFLFIKLKYSQKNKLGVSPLLRGADTRSVPGCVGGWQKILDLIIIPIPLLAMFIRIGNFFNSEIVGKTTNLPWGVKFPVYEMNPVARHPAQLYEAITLFTLYFLLFTLYKKYRSKLPPLFITNLFFILYFTSRFLIEYLKDFPTYFGLTTGQWLSLPFIIWGVIYFIKTKSKRFSPTNE
jgi:prolipoprotein diacylglyceryl transferase